MCEPCCLSKHQPARLRALTTSIPVIRGCFRPTSILFLFTIHLPIIPGSFLLFQIQHISRRLGGEAGGSDHAGEIAELCAQNLCAVRGLAEGDGESAATGALEEQIDRLDDAAAED